MKNTYHTLVVGSGAAGYNALDWLHNLGVTDIAMVTEGVHMGTSRNTGSDKQTYYKLALAGNGTDSVPHMAQTLFKGGSVHGDTAYVEAACSATSFMKLVHLGVPFPTNKLGAYVGYQTDHDDEKRQRATSCGPLTSKLMTEALERQAHGKGIEVIDHAQVVKILTQDNRVKGLIYIGQDGAYHTLYCQHIILATGGPAGVYQDVVFPKSQTGGTGLALAAGALGCNLQEWQYGLASIDFRWNVSGTYQQVLPRYISTGDDGVAHEFLLDHYKTPEEALNMVFLKGYQWPFDGSKVEGSSQIDQLVAIETNEKGRKVYMDYRENPTGLDFAKLSPEAREYLAQSHATFGTPLERLAKMNPKAIQLYKDNGIDLHQEPLRIAVCAQHCNGGIGVDAHWESSVKGLYVVGEAAGTFGVYRPGGSALNSGQVGSMRAAQHIASQGQHKNSHRDVNPVWDNWQVGSPPMSPSAFLAKTQPLMSRYAAYARATPDMEALYHEICTFLQSCKGINKAWTAAEHKSYDLLLTQQAVLSAIIFAAKTIGSRGGAIVDNQPITEQANHFNDRVVTTAATGSYFEPVRPMPTGDDWFENLWNAQNPQP